MRIIALILLIVLLVMWAYVGIKIVTGGKDFTALIVWLIGMFAIGGLANVGMNSSRD